MKKEAGEALVSTALLDAVGEAVRHIGNVHKYARDEDVPEHTIFVITTDGMENASRSYSREKVKQLIQRQQEKYGWEFVFSGANIDSAETAEGIGISRDTAVNYCADEKGTNMLYCAMSAAVSSARAGKKLAHPPISTSFPRKANPYFLIRSPGIPLAASAASYCFFSI